MAVTERLVVVSNRLPLTLRKTRDGWRADRSTGGLVTAVEPVLKRTGGLWIGWPGDAPAERDPGRDELLAEWKRREGCVAVDLPPEVSGDFYEGYANRALWPLFHHFPTSVRFKARGWEAYVEANTRFRDTLVAELRDGDVVWIHDYQLMLLPWLLRETAPAARIGFFLHIPFPASEVFRILPHREEVLRGLLGADFVAFQTHADLQHFRASLRRILGFDSRMDRVELGNRVVRLEALPIGIAPDEFGGLLEKDKATQRALAEYRKRFGDRRVLLAIDRLDYTKGLPQRLRTYRRLLERTPELRGRVVLVQVAVPSREKIPQYENLRRRVSEMVGELNGQFGTPDWTPIVYIHRGIPRSDLVALYALAAVGWVTPLRDGMNLVAKEYVACQRGGDGALVLSEFAGAAAEMGEAFLVNPYDEDRTAEILARVLTLPPEERRERMAALYRRVRRNNVFAWGERFLEGVRQAAAESTRMAPDTEHTLDEALPPFRAARSRLLLLDYDGTLVPYAKTPREAVPPAELLALLGRLAALPRTRVVLVSGRPRVDLDGWFAKVPGLWLVAEHGALVRPPGGAAWEAMHPSGSTTWKASVQPVLEHFADRTPGSFIEEKEYCLVWHYRMSDPDVGEWLANELVSILDRMLADTEQRVVRGHKTVEVRPAWATKGNILGRVERDAPAPDFRLAMGDDRTDEDLFELMPPNSWTVRVGGGPSRARFHLKGPAEVCAFLARLIEGERPAEDEEAAGKRPTVDSARPPAAP
ncbi:MAG TPA: bifunctional alpha,alpha-trehalose-phosphate synthase (UDP-forming)/trehalose-phosphatase [Vicinamibacteria bacterium]